MATSNEQIRDGLIRHQMGIIRVSGHLRNSIIQQMDRAQVDLQRMLRARLTGITERGVDAGPATTRRLQALERALDALMAPSHRTIDRLIKSELMDLAKHEIAYINTLISNALPVQVSFALPTADQLRSVVFSRPMQGRILKTWLADWKAADRRRIMEQIRIGIIQGESNAQIRRRVLGSAALGGADGIRNISKRGADFLTRTITNSVANNARQQFYRRNTDIIKKEVYSATLDSRTTHQCASLDGKLFTVNKGPIPPIHGRCRSTRYPFIEGIDLGSRPAVQATQKELRGLSQKARRRILNDRTGRLPATVNFEEFLRKQPRSFIEDYLGITKTKLFVDGKLKLSKFVDAKLTPRTVNQLSITESALFKELGIDT